MAGKTKKQTVITGPQPLFLTLPLKIIFSNTPKLGEYLYAKILRRSFIPSKDTDDQRILQSD